MKLLRNPEREVFYFRTRLLVATTVVVGGFLLLLLRFTWLQVIRHADFYAQAEQNRIALVPVTANRGLIKDRNGAIINPAAGVHAEDSLLRIGFPFHARGLMNVALHDRHEHLRHAVVGRMDSAAADNRDVDVARDLAIGRVYLPEEEEPRDAQGFRQVLVTESYHPYFDVWWPQGHIIGYEHTFVHEIKHFFDAIIASRSVAPAGADFEDGYRACVVADAIAESARTGQRVEIAY